MTIQKMYSRCDWERPFNQHGHCARVEKDVRCFDRALHGRFSVVRRQCMLGVVLIPDDMLARVIG